MINIQQHFPEHWLFAIYLLWRSRRKRSVDNQKIIIHNSEAFNVIRLQEHQQSKKIFCCLFFSSSLRLGLRLLKGCWLLSWVELNCVRNATHVVPLHRWINIIGVDWYGDESTSHWGFATCLSFRINVSTNNSCDTWTTEPSMGCTLTMNDARIIFDND